MPNRVEVAAVSVFSGKVAIVTGGASGLGRAFCEELARRGAIVVVADLNAKPEVDVSDFEALKRLVQETSARHGRLDYMFNNAGIAVVGELRDTAPEHWRRVMDVNLMGVIYGTLAAYQVMVPQGVGHIVNVSSVTGLIPSPVLTPYATTKWGIIGFSLSLRPEAATLGIKVSVACPGLVRTNIADRGTYLNVRKEDYLARLPWRWMTQPAQAAKAILRGVEKNKAMIISPWHSRLLWRLYRLSPALLTFLSNWSVKEWRKMRLPGKG
jgi:NAD(P)-dependent dehydrogenase (short-subunit alcohol dehydrogenase family)